MLQIRNLIEEKIKKGEKDIQNVKQKEQLRKKNESNKGKNKDRKEKKHAENKKQDFMFLKKMSIRKNS